MKHIIYIALFAVMLTGCSVYRNYERPQDLPLDSLYRDVPQTAADDTLSLGDLKWEEFFTDTCLRDLISYGLENNTDMQVAMLRVEQANAALTAAKLAFLPSLSFSPQAGIQSTGGAQATRSLELPFPASWQIDLSGSLLNAKREAMASLLQQEAYRQAVRANLISSIANTYYSLLMLDEQVRISRENLDIWQEQVRVLEARLKVGESTENAVTMARADYYGLQATHNDLQRQQREVENTLCTLLGRTSGTLDRGTLEDQQLPEQYNTGVPLYLLSHRPDVVQAEMTLAAACYATNQSRAAFYPTLTLGGSAGWTDALGKAVSDPEGWILSALASLTQPIFQRGKLVYGLKVSEAEEEIALLNYRQALLDAGQEVNDALYAVGSSRRNLEAHLNQYAELERTVHTSESLYNTNNATYLELLAARQSLLNAGLNVAQDRFTCLQSMITLYNSLGGGGE